MAIFKDNKPTKDGRTWYFSTYYKDLSGNNIKHKSKKYTTKKEAQEEERIFLLTTSDKIETRKTTFADLYNDYIHFQKDKVKVTTYRNYLVFKQYIGSLFKINIKEFDYNNFKYWKNEISNLNVSTRYKNNIYKFLLSLLNYAKKYYNINYDILFNQMTGFKNPNELKKEMLYFSYDEFSKYIKNVSELKYKAFFEVLYYCGLRKGEANSLNWNDINLKNKTININKSVSLKIKGDKYTILPPKTKNSIRILPMSKIVYMDLKKLKKEYTRYKNFDNNWFVFGGINPLADTTIENLKNKLCKEAEVKQIRVHDFRHSCASLLINNGASIALVSKYLGHSNISTTLNTYTHMFKSEMNDIINVIDKL